MTEFPLSRCFKCQECVTLQRTCDACVKKLLVTRPSPDGVGCKRGGFIRLEQREVAVLKSPNHLCYDICGPATHTGGHVVRVLLDNNQLVIWHDPDVTKSVSLGIAKAKLLALGLTITVELLASIAIGAIEMPVVEVDPVLPPSAGLKRIKSLPDGKIGIQNDYVAGTLVMQLPYGWIEMSLDQSQAFKDVINELITRLT